MENQKLPDQIRIVKIILPVGQPVEEMYSFPAGYTLDQMYKSLWAKKHIRLSDGTEIQMSSVVGLKITKE